MTAVVGNCIVEDCIIGDGEGVSFVGWLEELKAELLEILVEVIPLGGDPV